MPMNLEVVRKGNRGDTAASPPIFVHAPGRGPGAGKSIFWLTSPGWATNAWPSACAEMVAVQARRRSTATVLLTTWRMWHRLPRAWTPARSHRASMGGLVTQHYLARHPARAGVAARLGATLWRLKVVLKLLRQHPLRFLAANLRLNLHLLMNTPAKARELFHSAGVSDADVARYAQPLTSGSFLALLDMVFMNLPRRGSVNTPLRVLGGELDTILPPADVRATVAFHGTTAGIFDETAHDLMLEPRRQDVADDIHAGIQGGFQAEAAWSGSATEPRRPGR